MRHPLLLLSTVLVLGLSACTGEPDVAVEEPTGTPTATATATVTATETETVTAGPTAPAETSPDADVPQLAFTACTADRYTIGYPADWNVNEPDEPQDRELHWAVTVYIDAVEYARVTEGDGPNEELSSEELTVEGRRAHVREYRSTGDALVPEGERSYRYVIDLDGEILVVSTTTVGDTDYERDKAIIDRMVTEELSIGG